MSPAAAVVCYPIAALVAAHSSCWHWEASKRKFLVSSLPLFFLRSLVPQVSMPYSTLPWLLQAGWFPEWTLTEDFALGIELKKLNWQVREDRAGWILIGLEG